MDDDETRGGYQRRRARLLNWHNNDRTTTNERNEPRNDAHLAHEDEPVPLILSLGSLSYSSQIPPVTSSSLRRLAPSPFPPPSPTALTMMTYPTSSFPYPYQMVSRGSSSSSTPIHPLINFIPPSNQTTPAIPAVTSRPIRSAVQRNGSSQSAGNQRGDTIPPPFPWATSRRAEIHSLEYLESKQITTITGDVKCKYCEKVYQVSYNLRERFAEVEKIFVAEKRIMRERAPRVWKNPEPWRCELCGREKAVKPVIAERKSQINWLFMLLGQTLGYCTLQQLKNFCKHRKSHRTGAKDRVLYLTYLGLCKMLQPNRDLFNSDTGSKP